MTDRERAANTKKVGGTVARLVVALTGLGVSLQASHQAPTSVLEAGIVRRLEFSQEGREQIV